MKIKSLYIEKFKGLKDFYIEFNDKVTVLIGENGSGKTTVLEVIYNMLEMRGISWGRHDASFFFEDDEFEGCKLVLDIGDIGNVLEAALDDSTIKDALLDKKTVLIDKKLMELVFYRDVKKAIETGNYVNWQVLNNICGHHFYRNFREVPHVAYSPSQIDYEKYKVKSIEKMEESKAFNLILDAKSVSRNFKQFLVNQHYEDLEEADESGLKGNRIERFKELYKKFYEDKEFIGVKKYEPLFKVKQTEEIHSVDELSSGEKQIFFRAGAIQQYDFNNSIILLDEPELSLHPEWQQKVLDFYRDVVGENNQLIIATHSPHIVSSCKREEVRVLARDEETGNVKVREDVEQTYGWTVEQLLLTVFGAKSVRNPKVQKDLDRFKQLYIKKDKLSSTETEEMENLKKYLYSYLEAEDPELSLVNVEETTRRLDELLESLKGS